jgi:hypothetical protein
MYAVKFSHNCYLQLSLKELQVEPGGINQLILGQLLAFLKEGFAGLKVFLEPLVGVGLLGPIL